MNVITDSKASDDEEVRIIVLDDSDDKSNEKEDEELDDGPNWKEEDEVNEDDDDNDSDSDWEPDEDGDEGVEEDLIGEEEAYAIFLNRPLWDFVMDDTLLDGMTEELRTHLTLMLVNMDEDPSLTQDNKERLPFKYTMLWLEKDRVRKLN